VPHAAFSDITIRRLWM